MDPSDRGSHRHEYGCVVGTVAISATTLAPRRPLAERAQRKLTEQAEMLRR